MVSEEAPKPALVVAAKAVEGDSFALGTVAWCIKVEALPGFHSSDYRVGDRVFLYPPLA